MVAITTANTPTAQFWWDAEKGEVYKNIEQLLQHFATVQAYRLEEMLLYERMYGGRSMTGMTPFTYWNSSASVASDAGHLKRNVVKGCIDALAAEIAKHKPRAFYLSKRGSEKMKEKAKKRTRFVDGMFYMLKIYRLMKQAFFDACRVGTGVIKIYHDGHQVRAERVHASELFVVDAETIYGTTKQLVQVKYIAKTEALNLPFVMGDEEKEDIIKRAKAVSADGAKAPGTSEVIRIVESWRLPVKKGKTIVKPGRHVISVNTGDLHSEDWTRDGFPFAFYRYQDKAMGFWGSGVAEQLLSIQYEINKRLRIEQEATAFCSAPWVLTKNGPPQNKINVGHLRNEAGAVIDGGLGEVQVYTPNPIHPAFLQRLDQLEQKAYDEVGVSKAAATQQDDLGPDASGAARRERRDAYSARFALQHDQYDQFAVDLAGCIMESAAELKSAALSVTVPSGEGFDSVTWAETSPGEEMALQVYPTNFFSTTPAAKKQDVMDAQDRGWLTRELAMKQLDFPDMASETSLITAYIDHVDRIAGAILDTERTLDQIKETPGFWPEPFDDPNVWVDRMNRWLKRAQADEDADEDRLRLMRESIERAILVAGTKTGAGPAAGQQPMPPAPGGAPPAGMPMPGAPAATTPVAA